jgi:DNA-binding NarL/FixJ family response regulator
VSWTVLIVDDHASFRRLARRSLETYGFRVVGEAADGASAVCAARALDPGIVLLDVLLPDTDGFAVADRILQECKRAIVVLTSSREAHEFGARLERSSAHAFIHKGELSGEALALLAGGTS